MMSYTTRATPRQDRYVSGYVSVTAFFVEAGQRGCLQHQCGAEDCRTVSTYIFVNKYDEAVEVGWRSCL